MLVWEGWREETWSLPFLISWKRARNTLTGSWVCSVFSPKKMVIQILVFLLPVCELVCTQLLAAACTGLAFDVSEFLSSDPALPQGVTLCMLGSFSKVLVYSGLRTSLLCSRFSLPCTLVDSCSLKLSFYLCLSFFACEQLSQGHGCASHSWAWAQAAEPGAPVQPLALGRKPG